jgi:hypothetical protein
MAPWTFDVKFTCGTQFTFGSLTFVVGKMEISRCCPRVSTIAPRADIRTSSIFSGHPIYIRWCLLRSRSLCRVIYLHR